MNTITYTLENGTKIQQPINKQAFVDERGRKRTEGQMHKLFTDTAWDKRAVKYTIDSETDDSVEIDKEIHFTKNDKKLAKAQYKEFQKTNPNGFKNSLKQFQKLFVDAMMKNKRNKFNICNVILQ